MSHFNLNISLRNRKVPRTNSQSDITDLMPITHSPTDEKKSVTPVSQSTINSDNPANNSKSLDKSGDKGNPPPNNPTENLITDINPQTRTIMAKFDIGQATKMIPEFSGNSTELHRFLQLAEIQYKRTNTNEEKLDFLDIIISKISGRAYNTILRYKNFDDWGELKTSLIEKFSKTRSTQLVQIDVFALNQGYKESVSSYSERAEKLLDELNIASVTDSMSNDGSKAIRELNGVTVMNNFINGLRDPLKLIVRTARKASLSEAIELAIDEEKLNKTNFREDLNKKPYCFNCKTQTHFTKDCRKQNSNPNFKTNFNPNFNEQNKQTKVLK